MVLYEMLMDMLVVVDLAASPMTEEVAACGAGFGPSYAGAMHGAGG